MFSRWVVPILLSFGFLKAEPFDPTRLERETLVPNAKDPISLQVPSTDQVYFLERSGTLKRWNLLTTETVTLGNINALAQSDAGALDFLFSPDFSQSGLLYILYVPSNPNNVIRLARFQVAQESLLLESQKVLLEMPIEGGSSPPHCGGALAQDSEGNLLIGVGENTPPQDTPPVNHPEGKPFMDARRSAANSQDLRGKILRILPKLDGGYDIPEGNLFSDPKVGRTEIYAMGCRNPFRVDFDPPTGWIHWGDVGGNINEAYGLGWEGCDEIHLTKTPGFFGWPFFSGPNRAWRSFDPASKKPLGEPFDPNHPVNDSPQNTGLRDLPKAQPALIWYPSAISQEWPILGSGGRSITGGPIYRYSSVLESLSKLPQEYDSCLIFGDWMRNWLMAAHLSPDGKVERIEPFAPHISFRKPTQIRIGPDGALYLVEYGDRWSGNLDGQISRISYRRGNRSPNIIAAADVTAGKVPLTVHFDATKSKDPDGDTIHFTWNLPNNTTATGDKAEYVFTEPGQHSVDLVARDIRGGLAGIRLSVAVGNSPPRVRFSKNAGFFQWGEPFSYEVIAEDDEDGQMSADRILVQSERQDRAVSSEESQGLLLMRSGTCFACHSTSERSAGPPYLEVAKRYSGKPEARETLAKKIISGGGGVWSPIPMPPHPQHSADQARQMVDWILGLIDHQAQTLPRGLKGEANLPEPPQAWGQFQNGLVVLTATATDLGGKGVPSLRAEARCVLRTRRQMAYFFDESHLARSVDFLEEGGAVASITGGGWIAFHQVALQDVKSVQIKAWPHTSMATVLELATSKDGPALAKAEIPATSKPPTPSTLNLALQERPKEPTSVFLRFLGQENDRLDLSWVHFE